MQHLTELGRVHLYKVLMEWFELDTHIIIYIQFVYIYIYIYIQIYTYTFTYIQVVAGEAGGGSFKTEAPIACRVEQRM